MTTLAAPPRLTLDEFLAFPEEKPYREYLRGDVTEKPMPTDLHGTSVAEMTFELVGHLRRTREGTAKVEVRHALRDLEWVFLPDIEVRVPALPIQRRGVVETPPEFAIEVRPCPEGQWRAVDQ